MAQVKYRHWTTREIKYVADHHETVPIWKMAIELNRTHDAIRSQLRRLKDPTYSRKPWTQREIDILKQFSIQLREALPGRNWGGIEIKLRRLQRLECADV